MLLDSAGHSLGNSLFAAQMEADPVRKQNLEYLVSQREFESYQYVHEEAMQRGVSQEEFDEYVRLKAWHKFIRLGDKTSAKQIIQEEGQQEIEWSRIDSGALFNFASDDAFSDRAMVAEPHAVGRYVLPPSSGGRWPARRLVGKMNPSCLLTDFLSMCFVPFTALAPSIWLCLLHMKRTPLTVASTTGQAPLWPREWPPSSAALVVMPVRVMPC